MLTLNTTIDNVSPLITYEPSGAWRSNKGGSTETWTQNATATFAFQGTWVAVNGTKNKSHGAYTVKLDDGPPRLFNASTPSDLFKTQIFNSGPIPAGQHTLIISNVDSRWVTLDIDSISWSCDPAQNASAGASLHNFMVDDTEDAFAYAPHGSWDMDLPAFGDFSEKTGHSTSTDHASVNFTFSGDAVSIFGTTGPENSQYIVHRQGRPPHHFNATRNIYVSQVLLYFGDQFGPGNHTVTLAKQTPGLFQIDYAVVHTTNSLLVSPSSSSAPVPSGSRRPGPPVFPQDLPSPPTKLPAGAIVAIVITALAFLILVAALWLLLRRNKTLWMRLQRGYMVQSQFDSGSPPNGVVTPLPYSTPPPPRSAPPQTARSKTTYIPVNDDESFEAPPLDRACTMQSTASTLVADHGSLMTQVGSRRLSLKPLQLASRWGPGTPTTQSHISRTPSARHNSRSLSARHLLREESASYGTEGALGIQEVSEDRIEEVLRHPIRRNEPSTYPWQSALP